MKLLPREWDLIIRALGTHLKKIEADNLVGFPDYKGLYEKRVEINSLIERIELNK